MMGALIARLEKAETGREIEVRIYVALHPDQRTLFDAGDLRTRRPATYGRLADFGLDGWTDWEALAMTFGAPQYTASLDAALTLVPEGWTWQVSGPDLSERAFAYVREYQPDQPRPMRPDAEGSARVPSPALALCIAALKARQAANVPKRP